MTNTKQLTGAVALLASIAVLDNFVFVEQQPGFESMVLIQTSTSELDDEAGWAGDQSRQENKTAGFWIDQHKVNSTEFAKFLNSTGYEPQEIALHSQQAIPDPTSDIEFSVLDGKLREQTDHSSWKKASASFPMNHTLAGQDDLKVSIKDAQSYCNWLGKVLPTIEQINSIAAHDQENMKPFGPIEFRCVRNI